MQLRNITCVRVWAGAQHVVHSMHSSKAELRMLVEQLRPHYVHALVTPYHPAEAKGQSEVCVLCLFACACLCVLVRACACLCVLVHDCVCLCVLVHDCA